MLKIDPSIPQDWPGFKLDYRFGATHYRITVENPQGINHGIQHVSLNGLLLPDNRVPLSDDQREHEILVTMGVAVASDAR